MISVSLDQYFSWKGSLRTLSDKEHNELKSFMNRSHERDEASKSESVQTLLEIGSQRLANHGLTLEVSDKVRMYTSEGMQFVSREQYESEKDKVQVHNQTAGNSLIRRTESSSNGMSLLNGRNDVSERIVLAGANVNSQSVSKEQLIGVAELMTSKEVKVKDLLSQIGAFQADTMQSGIYGQLRAGGVDNGLVQNSDGTYKQSNFGFYSFGGQKREYSMKMEFTLVSGERVSLELDMSEKVVKRGNFLNKEAPGEIRRYMDLSLSSTTALSEKEATELEGLVASANSLFNDYFDSYRFEEGNVQAFQSSIANSERFINADIDFSQENYASGSRLNLEKGTWGYVDDETGRAFRSDDTKRITVNVTRDQYQLTDYSTEVTPQHVLDSIQLGKTFLGEHRT